MLILTLDPISMNNVTDIDGAPYVVEGAGTHALKIYFENETNKAKYMDMPLLDAVGVEPRVSDNLQDSPNKVAIN